MFHRRNRIILAAGIAVAVIAAMAGPAGARASAGGQVSTPVPVDITGDITWTVTETPPYAGTNSGADTQTGTAHFRFTNVVSNTSGASGTYSVTDNTNLSNTPPDNCPNTTTGSASASGSFPLPFTVGSPAVSINIQLPSNPNVQVGVSVPVDETFTRVETGDPSLCAVGTTTYTQPAPIGPLCANAQGKTVVSGVFQGTYPNGTVNLDCSGTFIPSIPGSTGGSTSSSVTGTLTITPSCGSAASSQTQRPAAASSQAQASSAAASVCGLTITSPPDNSTIALTDPNYVDGPGLPITDTSREPDLSQLMLKVAGTSTCPGPVTVNGVSATPNGDNWDVKIPIVSLGSVTLTAKAAGCTDVSSMVTLINLEITKPAEQDSLPITAGPAMPDLNATVSVLGYTGDTSRISFDWTLDVRGETVTRPGSWQPYTHTTTGSTTGTGGAWKPSYDQIVGGVGRLTVTASLPGVTDTVTSFPRWINIPGSALGKAIILAYLQQSSDAQYADKISQIFCDESRWHQFNTKTFEPGNRGQPPIPDVPANWTPNPGVGQPLYGPKAGIGIAQLDLETGTLPLADYWNWQTNVQDGIAVFDQKLALARGLAATEQARLTKRLNRAVAIAKANRKKINDQTPPTVPPLITVPQLSDQETLWEAIRLYNGHHEFHFNADYILSANGLDVVPRRHRYAGRREAGSAALTFSPAAGCPVCRQAQRATGRATATIPTPCNGRRRRQTRLTTSKSGSAREVKFQPYADQARFCPAGCHWNGQWR